MQILNGPDLDSPILDTFCSTHKPELKSAMHSTSNEVIVIFKADSSAQSGTGFDLSWGSQVDECGNQIIQAMVTIFILNHSKINLRQLLPVFLQRPQKLAPDLPEN